MPIGENRTFRLNGTGETASRPTLSESDQRRQRTFLRNFDITDGDADLDALSNFFNHMDANRPRSGYNLSSGRNAVREFYPDLSDAEIAFLYGAFAHSHTGMTVQEGQKFAAFGVMYHSIGNTLRNLFSGKKSLPVKRIAESGNGQLSNSSGGVPKVNINNINIRGFEIKNKHLSGTTSIRTRQFNVFTAPEANRIVQDALRNGRVVETLPNGIGSQGQSSFSTIIDVGRVIGTRGETHIKIIHDILNNVWTTYPVPTP